MSKISKFISGLYTLLENENNSDIIMWNELGSGLIISDQDKFQILLKQHNKNSNVATFMRQLSMYGFRRAKQLTNSKEYSHPMFQKGNKTLLTRIQRLQPTIAIEFEDDCTAQHFEEGNKQLYKQIKALRKQQVYLQEQIAKQAQLQLKLSDQLVSIAQSMQCCESCKGAMNLFVGLVEGMVPEVLGCVQEFAFPIMDEGSTQALSPIPFQYPLKKKFQMPPSTSRGNRISAQDNLSTVGDEKRNILSCNNRNIQYTNTSKSPFRQSNDYLIRCNQLEQELHRVNQQRKLMALEMDELSNQFIQKSRHLQEIEVNNSLLQQKLQNGRNSDEILKLQQLLKQKNQVILEWTNRYMQLERRLEQEQRVEEQLKSLQMSTECYKEQLVELKYQNKMMQDSYHDIKEERNKLQQQLFQLSLECDKLQKQEQKNKSLEGDLQDAQSALQEYEQKLTQLQNDNNGLSDQIQQLNLEKQRSKQQQELQSIQQESMISKSQKWKTRCKQLQQYHDQLLNESLQISKDEKEDNQELIEKCQQQEVENQYLREQNMEIKLELQQMTDKLLKQQLQQSFSKEYNQTFSFQEQRFTQQDSRAQQYANEEEHEHVDEPEQELDQNI